MQYSEAISYTNQVLLLVLYLSMPPIIVATVVGVLVAAIQGMTQIQEQTLSFGIKLLATSLTLALTIYWMGSSMIEFTEQIFTNFPKSR